MVHDGSNWQRSTPQSRQFTKVSRENIQQLLVETERCPDLLTNVLGTLAERELVPFTISARRDGPVHLITIELASLSEIDALSILQRLRRLKSVRRALIGPPAPRAVLPNLVAKL